MSKIAIDLKDFKHVRTEKGTTTLEHKEGHQLTLQHAKLPPDALKQLSSLAVSDQTPEQSEEAREQRPVKMADGGTVPAALQPNSIDNTEPIVDTNLNDIAASTDAAAPTAQQDLQKRYLDNVQHTNYDPNAGHLYGMGDKGYDPNQAKLDAASGKEVDISALQDAKAAQDAEIAAKRAANNSQVFNNAQQNAAKAALGLAPDPSLAQPEQVPGQQPQGDPSQASQQPQDPYTMAGDAVTAGFGEQRRGIMDMAKAQGDLGKAEAAAIAPQVQAQQAAQSAFNEQYDGLNRERQGFIQDLQNAHVDPEKYWDDHSKIAAGIGMVLAGFNPTGKPNAAIEMLNHQMDRNIQAQVQNLGTKKTLLEANMRQYGNLRDATDMTRVMQNDIAAKQLRMTAAKMASPIAKAQAEQAAGQLDQQAGQWQMQLGMRRAMMNLSSKGGEMSEAGLDQMMGYLQMQNPQMYKEMIEKRVPGMGLASVPVPAEARKSLVDKQQFNQAAQDLLAFSKAHTGSLDPKVIATGKQMAMRLQGLYREDVLGTVYRDSEKNLLDKAVGSDPTSFFNNISNIPKLNEVIRSNNESLGIQAKSFGLRPPQSSMAPQASQPVARKTADGRTALFDPATKKFLGYQK